MMRLKISLMLLFTFLYPNTTWGIHKVEKDKKTGILLVSFGTSYANAQGALDHIETQVKKEFPDVEVRWAFTSNMIRKILKERGQNINSPAQALAHMGADGFTHIAVQSLHIIPGKEYESLNKTVIAFNKIPKNAHQIILGKPLLYQHNNIMAVCSALHTTLSPDLTPGNAIVMMGHGTEHAANIYYPGLQYYLWQKSPMFFLGTVESYPSLGDIIPELKAQKVKTVSLMPFMSVAGDHAQNDMASNGSDSWKSILENEGFEVKVIMKGLAEYDSIGTVWINHLKEAWNELEN